MPAAAPPAKAEPQDSPTPTFSRVQKLAAFLVILGPEAAAQVLRGFDAREVEDISAEMAKFPMISPELQEEILHDFSQVAVQAGTCIRGGVDVTRATLEKAIGVFKATEILSRVAPSHPSVDCVLAIDEMEPRQIYNLTRQEQPQTIALMLSYISPAKAAEALTFFAPEQRDKILERVATLAPTPVEVIEKVVEVLLARRGSAPTRALNQTGGVKTAADVLNSMDKTQGKSLLGTLEERNPELGQAIRQKMFTFEDLVHLDANMLQRILREVDVRELALALKRNASDKLKAALLGAITKRAAETVQEEINFMGPVRLKDIEAAQMRIIDAVRRLEAEGTIDLSEAQGKGDQ
jgi:flagellar motor switch protein FliG